jgi:hypothetical protein
MTLSILAIRDFLPSDPGERALAHARIKNAIRVHRGYIFKCIGPPNRYHWVIWYVL